jgi:O-antigen/teichoic acid export membrane protein
MIDLIRSKKKILMDFFYNTVGSLISVLVLQILIYPILAKLLHSSEYGLLLTAMGIVNTISGALGNTLNNTRLIQNAKYNESSIKGDFNLILLLANIVGYCFTIFIGFQFLEYDFFTILLLSFLAVLIIIKSYFIVAYRIVLNYRLNLLSNIAAAAGYLLGIYLVYKSTFWPLVFIVAEIFNIAFVLFTTDLHKEPYKITPLLRETTGKYLLLIITSLLGNLLVYLDRLIIYPVLGGESVSIYTTASMFGKSLGLVMIPMAGVLLSYFAQKNFVMNRRKYWLINLFVFISSFVFFIFSYFVAPWFTGLLYPTLISQAREYILYANLAAIISAAANMIQPAVLRYAPTFWQVVKEIIYGIAYLGLGFIFLKSYGLLGFCWAAIIANIIRLVLLCVIGTIYMGNKDSKDI